MTERFYVELRNGINSKCRRIAHVDVFYDVLFICKLS